MTRAKANRKGHESTKNPTFHGQSCPFKAVFLVALAFSLIFYSSVVFATGSCSVCNETCSPCGGGCTATDMTGMFDSVNDWSAIGNISGWDTSCVTSMNTMFYSTTGFDQDISAWDTSQVTDMSGMFASSDFNGNISGWNVSSVVSMNTMFYGDAAFNQPVGGWDMSHVAYAHGMLSYTGLTQDLSSWNVSSMVDVSNMFEGSIFNGDISGWDTRSFNDVGSMFAGDYVFNQPIGAWNMSSVTNTAGMFTDAVAFNQPLNAWDTSNVAYMNSMFSGALSFNQPIGSWDTHSVQLMGAMFNYDVMFNQDINSWNVSSVVDMSGMFYGCGAYNQPMSSWDTSHVNNMNYMFFETVNFNQDITGWNTSSVLNMAYMFAGAEDFNQPIGVWDTSKVEDLSGMFAGADSFNQPIGTWDTSNVNGITNLFYDNTIFNQPLGSWDTHNVIYAGNAFFGATAFNQSLGGWNVSDVTDTTGMFMGASSFNQNLSAWDVSGVTAMDGMLDGSALSSANYDALLNGWAAESVQSFVVFGANDTMYTPIGLPGRDILTGVYNWTILDGGILVPPGNETANITIPPPDPYLTLHYDLYPWIIRGQNETMIVTLTAFNESSVPDATVTLSLNGVPVFVIPFSSYYDGYAFTLFYAYSENVTLVPWSVHAVRTNFTIPDIEGTFIVANYTAVTVRVFKDANAEVPRLMSHAWVFATRDETGKTRTLRQWDYWLNPLTSYSHWFDQLVGMNESDWGLPERKNYNSEVFYAPYVNGKATLFLPVGYAYDFSLVSGDFKFNESWRTTPTYTTMQEAYLGRYLITGQPSATLNVQASDWELYPYRVIVKYAVEFGLLLLVAAMVFITVKLTGDLTIALRYGLGIIIFFTVLWFTLGFLLGV